MLVPRLRVKNWQLCLGNVVLIILLWDAQATGLRWGLSEPIRSEKLLLVLTLFVGIAGLLPSALPARFSASQTTYIARDANILLILYQVIYLAVPRVLIAAYPLTSVAGAGIIFSLLGVIMMYMPRNGVIGIRIPSTAASPVIWHKTNVLGGRLFFLLGMVILLVAGLLGDTWGLIVMGVGTVIMAVVTVSYGHHLSKMAH